MLTKLSIRHLITSIGQKSFNRLIVSGFFESLKTTTMETAQRQTYMDWLRILSILGVLVFYAPGAHAAAVFHFGHGKFLYDAEPLGPELYRYQVPPVIYSAAGGHVHHCST